MTRSLTTAVKNHLATNEIRPVHLITIGFATPQNITDNVHDLTSSISGSSVTYSSSSFLVSLPSSGFFIGIIFKSKAFDIIVVQKNITIIFAKNVIFFTIKN